MADITPSQQSSTYDAERTSKLLTETMLWICTGPIFDVPQKQEIAMNSLIPAHHPNLRKSCYRSFSVLMKVKPTYLI